jgi:hypothetical protein
LEPTLALVLALIGGFRFVETWRRQRFALAREEGHRLYFAAAYAGAVLFTVSALLLLILHLFAQSFALAQQVEAKVVDVTALLLKDQKPNAAAALIIAASILSLILGGPFAQLLNLAGRHKDETSAEADARVLADALQYDALELMLIEATQSTQQVMVTLTTGKVYVGFVLGTADPKKDRKVIELLPLMSGYRDEKQKVTFTTFYDELIRGESVDEDDLRLVVMLDKVQSLSYFDSETYAKFQQHGRAAPAATKVADAGDQTRAASSN